jgi:uncharacterized protein YjbI with pentapeptide repeats
VDYESLSASYRRNQDARVLRSLKTLREIQSGRVAVLTDATFRKADLRKVSFEHTPLTGVDFNGAMFHQMDFYGPIDLTPCRARPANAQAVP